VVVFFFSGLNQLNTLKESFGRLLNDVINSTHMQTSGWLGLLKKDKTKQKQGG
jgi:hypothetical protein